MEGSLLKSRWPGAILAVILASSFALKLRHLDHAAIKPLDEVFHAIVARNFLKHPLTPTLVDQPFLAYDQDNWLSNHIWLHKPPMAMWQIAVFYAIFGVGTLALRLPSAILSTGAVWITYGIGSELLDRKAGLIAAALQAFNPVILMLVQGYVFSDHVDISLLFWTELSIYFLCRGLRTRRQIDLILCGVWQGLAFLSKTYPALIVLVLAVVAGRQIRLRGIVTIVVSTIAAAGPWMAWIAIRFPREFVHENFQILHHLSGNVENWAAPWDQVVFYYWISIFHVFYPAIIAAVGIFVFRAARERRLALLLILAWLVGVGAANLAAVSKPMSATLIGWPAAWLVLGDMISRAARGDRVALGAWMASMFLGLVFLNEKSIPVGGENWGHTDLPFGSIMRQHLWVVWHAGAAILAGLLLARVGLSREMQTALVALAAGAAVWLAVGGGLHRRPHGYAAVAWEVTSINANAPNFARIGEFAARLPGNAALLVDEQDRLENKLVEFAADRSCYPCGQDKWAEKARQLEAAGALPYLLTPASLPLPLPVVFVDLDLNRTVYACDEAAKVAAGK
jgi:4-amino-4-deoxy-L-arabinose transferase